MRIAFVSHGRRKVGGVEAYLDSVIPALATAHEISYLHETDVTGGEPIALPDDVPRWDVAQLGREQALDNLRAWKPNVCFVHGLKDPYLEASIVALGNAVLYVHNYYGSCVSGNKTLQNGASTPCDRKFGATCLLHYFPDRCGGLNPFTMLSLYNTQSRRLELMRRYRMLITNSEHMNREMARYDLASECVYPFTSTHSVVIPSGPDFACDPLRLIFSGRAHALKGGSLLIAAASEVQRRLGRKLHVTFAGDGPDRAAWQRNADSMHNGAIEFEFMGWLGTDALREKLSQSHLHVMPSVWPEPFGLAGLEAGLLGVPTVAFAVGGIPEWLHDGVNGHLAASPSTPANLANAIVRTLDDRQHYIQLRAGALDESHRYELGGHVNRLLQIFARCVA